MFFACNNRISFFVGCSNEINQEETLQEGTCDEEESLESTGGDSVGGSPAGEEIERETVLGEQYRYEIAMYRKEDFTVKNWEIEVYEGEKYIQTISYEHPLGVSCLPTLEEMIWEEDVNFDGVKDLMIGIGFYPDGKRYYCYLYDTEKKEFVFCPGLENIAAPQVDAENQLIFGNVRSSSVYYKIKYLKIENGSFVTVKTEHYEYNHEKEEYDQTVVTILPVLIDERQALDMAYHYLYHDLEIGQYSVFCEELSEINKGMSYVVAQFQSDFTGQEAYQPGNFQPEKNKTILSYVEPAYSTASNYYCFHLYSYIYDGEGNYHCSTLNYIYVSVNGEHIIAERTDREGNDISDPAEWNVIYDL